MKKEDYLKSIKIAKGNNALLLVINSRLAVDIDIPPKDKKSVFRAIIAAKK